MKHGNLLSHTIVLSELSKRHVWIVAGLLLLLVLYVVMLMRWGAKTDRRPRLTLVALCVLLLAALSWVSAIRWRDHHLPPGVWVAWGVAFVVSAIVFAVFAIRHRLLWDPLVDEYLVPDFFRRTLMWIVFPYAIFWVVLYAINPAWLHLAALQMLLFGLKGLIAGMYAGAAFIYVIMLYLKRYDVWQKPDSR